MDEGRLSEEASTEQGDLIGKMEVALQRQLAVAK